MELKQKGTEANVGGFNQLMVSMKWTTAADFDLAAAYEDKHGTYGLVYFGNLGDLNAFPYMQLSGDEGVDDAGGDNEETMRISKLDDLKQVWILCWDYGMVNRGAPLDLKIAILLSQSLTIKVLPTMLHSTQGIQVILHFLATINNTSPIGPKLINSSKAGTLNGLKQLQQVMDFIIRLGKENQL